MSWAKEGWERRASLRWGPRGKADCPGFSATELRMRLGVGWISGAAGQVWTHHQPTYCPGRKGPVG